MKEWETSKYPKPNQSFTLLKDIHITGPSGIFLYTKAWVWEDFEADYFAHQEEPVRAS